MEKMSEYFVYEKILNYGIDEVYEVIKDEEGKIMDSLPNIAGGKILEKKILKDGGLYIKSETIAKAPIPKIVQHILSESMLKWIYEGVWDKKTYKNTWRVKAPYFLKAVHSDGDIEFKSLDRGKKTKVIMRTKVKIDYPIFGKFIEEQIWKYYKKNLEIFFKIVNKILAAEKN